MNAQDYENPDWNEGGKVHNWKNYVDDRLRQIWHTFTFQQKVDIALNAQQIADNEEWE